MTTMPRSTSSPKRFSGKIKNQVRIALQELLAKRGYQLRKREVVIVQTVPRDPLDAQHHLLHKLGIDAPTILDLGANVGGTAARYRALFPRATIHAFEPFPANLDKLRAAAAADPLLKVYPLAVSNHIGQSHFHLNRHPNTHSLLPRAQSDRRYFSQIAGPTGECILVDCTTVDAFCQTANIQQVDILKLDVQGSEMAVLQGAQQMLEAAQPALIFTEAPLIHHYEGEGLLHQIWQFLDGYDYSLFDLYHLYRAANGQLRYCEALFIHSRVRKGVLNQFAEEP